MLVRVLNMRSVRILADVVDDHEPQRTVLEELERVAIAHGVHLHGHGIRAVVQQVGGYVANRFVSPRTAPLLDRPIVRKGEKDVISFRIENVKEGNDRIGQVLGHGPVFTPLQPIATHEK